ncbi:Fc.00g032590.m01.CDS01 [Cosmosporella sp. VM-42]
MSLSREEEEAMLLRVQNTIGGPDVDKRLCLLSLDGGGVRGLSTLYILRKIMTKVNAERQKKGQGAVKPCEVFDLIGGTSTGGLITILLGRLEIGVDDCITLYKALMGSVFGQKTHFNRVKLTTGKVQNMFNQEPLKEAVENVLRSKGIPVDQLYDDGQERTSRTFVVARRMESTKAVVIRDYTEPGETNDDKLTIVEAALATSAASTFFPPVEVRGKRYVDGALGTSNPTPLVWQAAQDIWANYDGQILEKVKCFISIGTGKPGFKGIKESAWGFVTGTLKSMVTQTEETETNFAKDHRFLIPFEGEQKYYRFNVESGLENVGLEEHEKVDLIEVATYEYLDTSQQRKFEVDRCSMRVASKKHQIKMECNECIRTLLYPGTESLSEDIKWYRRWDQNIKKPSPGSLKWLWESDTSLGNWIEANSGVFRIRGNGGSGKSVAMKHFFNEYKKRKRGEIVIGFFFNKLGSALEHRFEGLLRILLGRLLRDYPALFNCIYSRYCDMLEFIPQPHERETRHVDWGLGDLEDAMELIFSNNKYEANIVLFVDAINECDDMEQDKLIRMFRSYSESKSIINFKVCFSSTTDIDLEERYAGHLPSLDMQDKTKHDLELYIRACFEEGTSSSRFDESDLGQILSGVLAKAEGCWLWVENAVSLVNKRSSTLGTVKRGLEKLPEEMAALYETFLTSVDDEHAEETNDMLAVVLATAIDNSPYIFIDDFRYILGFCLDAGYTSQASMEGQDDFMKTNAILRCRIQERFGHLLVVQNVDDDDADGNDGKGPSRDRNGRVQLYHSTVKDFLSQRKSTGQSRILPGQDLQRRGLEILTKACLRFVQCKEVVKLMHDLESQGARYFKQVEDSDAVCRRLPLLVFALKSLPLISCEAIQRNTANSDQLKAYWTNRNFETWKSILNTILERNAVEPETTLTALCIKTDCDTFVRHLIEHQGVEPDEFIPQFGSYLCLAVYSGSVKVVKMLLSLDRYVDIDYCSPLGTALTIAAMRGDIDIFDALLEKGANPDVSGGVYQDPLTAAATMLNLDIIRRLWEHPYSSVSLRHSKFRTSQAILAIDRAMRYAYVVKDTEPSNRDRRIVSEVIHILAHDGLEVSVFTPSSVPVLLWGVCVGSTEVMDLMLRDPTMLLFRSPLGQTLLHIVSAAGTLSMVKLIIKKFENVGLSLDVRDGRQGTLLHYAALNDDPAVVQYLLSLTDLDLDPNEKDRYGLTPLHTAFARGAPKTVLLLLDAGARTDKDGPEGLSMLHLAASNFQHPEVLNILADKPVDIKDHWDRTPLHIASQYGSDKSVQWLLDRGLDASTTDAQGRTALHCACQNQCPHSVNIIDLLLQKGLSPSATDAAGSTPLHLAFHDSEHPSPYLCWLAYTTDYWDVFSEAECARKVAQMLAVDNKEEFINIQDDEGNTPLHLACWRGMGAVVRTLLVLPARCDLRDERGCFPYQLIEDSGLREQVEAVITTQSTRLSDLRRLTKQVLQPI